MNPYRRHLACMVMVARASSQLKRWVALGGMGPDVHRDLPVLIRSPTRVPMYIGTHATHSIRCDKALEAVLRAGWKPAVQWTRRCSVNRSMEKSKYVPTPPSTADHRAHRRADHPVQTRRTNLMGSDDRAGSRDRHTGRLARAAGRRESVRPNSKRDINPFNKLTEKDV